MAFLISCETGGHEVPEVWADRLANHPVSHDPLARRAASEIADHLCAPLIAHRYSADLIDVSRSLGHRKSFSPLTKDWDPADKRMLGEQLHEPYRARIRSAIKVMLDKTVLVVHLSVRTFDLVQAGKRRRTDVGLLYDPTVDDELDFCLDVIDEMYETAPMLRVRRNYPRRGTVDSIVRAMRRDFQDAPYLGIELWLNRAWVGRPVSLRDEALAALCRSLAYVISPVYAGAA